MDFAQITRTRRTVNSFTAAKVEDAVVREALELSLWAPNHRLTFPIRYVDLGPDTRARLAELAVELKSARAPLSEVQRGATRDSVIRPSHLIVLGLKRQENPAIAYEDYATLACGVQIATTHLWDRGIATKWSTAGWAMNDRAYEIMGLDPAAIRLEGCLMIGFPNGVPRAPARPAFETIFTNRD